MASWLNNAIFYEVYPPSFNDSNGDGIGDFQGIIDKLQYVRDLGCNAIWINPCFDSSFYDAGYDVRDYYITAERYGSNATCSGSSSARTNWACTCCSTSCRGIPQSTIRGSSNPARTNATHGPTATSGDR